MKKSVSCLMVILLTAAAVSVKLSYDPKKGYSYTITAPSAEEAVAADVTIKNYLRKGKLPPSLVKPEEKK